MNKMRYTVEADNGTWFQLWWDGDECVYSVILRSATREGAEKEAAQNAATSPPLNRVMEAMGCQPKRPEGDKST